MHTTVFLDKDQRPLRPAIMWNDKRTMATLARIKETLPKDEKTANIHHIISTGSPLANLLWLKEFEVEAYHRLDKLIIAKDFVRLVLTGEIATDYCDASTSSLFNVIDEVWSTEVLDTFDLPSHLLPNVKSAAETAGNLRLSLFDIEESYAIPVVVGTGDNAASAVANQTTGEYVPIISLGTSGVFILSGSKENWQIAGKNILAKISSNDDTVITQGVLQSGAKVIDWWSSKVIKDNMIAFEAQLQAKLGENQVLFFPYLSGDKTLFKNAGLTGAFYGFDFESGQNDFSLAIYEGIAFAMKRITQVMKTSSYDKVLLTGGGAKSKIWPKIFANVLNKTVCISKEPREASCGAAMIAYYSIYNRYPKFHNQLREIEPDETLTHQYHQNYKRFISFSDVIINMERRDEYEA